MQPLHGTEEKFVYRVRQFIGVKRISFHSMVEEEYIPVLISGAADTTDIRASAIT